MLRINIIRVIFLEQQTDDLELGAAQNWKCAWELVSVLLCLYLDIYVGRRSEI